MRTRTIAAARHRGTGGGGTPAYLPYISASAFNTPIPGGTAIHPSSSLMISATNNWLLGGTANDSFKEWLGPGTVSGDRATYWRGDTSTLGTISMHANNNGVYGAGPFTMPMPSWVSAVIGPTCESGDANLLLVDSVTGDVWECFHTTPPGKTPRDASGSSANWNCTGYRHWSTSTVTSKGYASPSLSFPAGTSASKIQLACGMLVPEDFADCFSGSDPGTAVPHMTRMDSFCGSSGANWSIFTAPAFGGDGHQAHGIPAGARVQLDPTINVGTWPSVVAKPAPWSFALMKILRGHQQFGICQVDSTGAPGAGNIDAVSGASVVKGGDTYPAGYQWPWDAAGVGGGYQHGVPYELMVHYRVIDWTVWTGA